MKPIVLHGHERSITLIKYNRMGDLLFSSGKDTKPNVWYSLNGERLGTYNGHGGAVWCFDINWESTKFASGAADNSLRLWDCELGKTISKFETSTAVRTCNFSYCGNKIVFTTDKQMGHDCHMIMLDIRQDFNTPVFSIPVPHSKVTSSIWGPLDDMIITGHDNGELIQWDTKSGEKLYNNVQDHSKAINDIQMYKDGTMFVTASKDTTAKLFDTNTLNHLKTYKTERPVNSAALSPIKNHVCIGGGQEAMEVTTTSTRIGKFDARFYHTIFEEEIGRVKGHFGPINSLAFHPDGRSYSSGGEDGYVRIHVFDPSYYELEFES
ncbi:eukaryotic translation initiation factor 3 subunit I-like [Actinia tenebrosa]|uniref:Eukaryotic translation initiation factor 3 subunit I n=1 Tax=Actinia tenebrosa TaxID=6105 RepID=A0A6P8I4L7_ACTTE|nr:eukaryotic translation initiation factor 3 subunit I-like [Actinia tenebrosa]